MNTKRSIYQPDRRRPSRGGRLAALFMAVLLAVLLAACGGEETSPPAETQVEPPTAVPEADEPTAVAEEVQPTEPPPTEAPPTAEPTTAPTTAAPEDSVQATGGGDCDNPFFPVVEGRTYRYQTTIPGIGTSEVAQTYSDVSDESFTITISVDDGEVMTNTWRCTDDGILSPEFSQMPGETEGLTIEFVEADGVTIPSADRFRPGESWTTHYVANATMSDTDAGAMTMIQTIDLTHTVVGTESVSVPAGDYPDAFRVDTTGSISVSMSIGDTQQPGMSFDMDYSSWYVEDVGLVYQEFPDLMGGETSITELVAVE